MPDLYATASTLHAYHLELAEAALECNDLLLFHLHSKLCNTIAEFLTTSKDGLPSALSPRPAVQPPSRTET